MRSSSAFPAGQRPAEHCSGSAAYTILRDTLVYTCFACCNFDVLPVQGVEGHKLSTIAVIIP